MMDDPVDTIDAHGDRPTATVTEASESLVRAVEALLFAAHEQLPASTLAAVNGHSGWSLDDVVTEINRRLEAGHHPMRVRQVAGGYQMHLLPDFGPLVESVLVKTRTQRLTRAGLETLAIIAYRQPCSTPEIERIRGVACDGVLRTLLERNLVTIKGRSDGPGRPLLYGTTPEFLHYFGLQSLEDLPREEELAELLAARTDSRPPADMERADVPPNAGATTAGHPLILRREAEPPVPRFVPFLIEDVVAASS